MYLMLNQSSLICLTARRKREIADADAKFNASEELKEEMDHWALTSDGTYKDLRALLSSLPDVRSWKSRPSTLHVLFFLNLFVRFALFRFYGTIINGRLSLSPILL